MPPPVPAARVPRESVITPVMAPPVPPFSAMAEEVRFCRSKPPVVASTDALTTPLRPVLLLISAAIDAAPSTVPVVPAPAVEPEVAPPPKMAAVSPVPPVLSVTVTELPWSLTRLTWPPDTCAQRWPPLVGSAAMMAELIAPATLAAVSPAVTLTLTAAPPLMLSL